MDHLPCKGIVEEGGGGKWRIIPIRLEHLNKVGFDRYKVKYSFKSGTFNPDM